jgi:hypothetical protein
MKTKSFILVVSLLANAVLLGLLLRQPGSLTESPRGVAASEPTVDEILPLPKFSVPLTAPALLPTVEPQWTEEGPSPVADPQARAPSTEEEKPYAPPPPPNPHASPAWKERLPYRESQIQRTLLTEPKR